MILDVKKITKDFIFERGILRHKKVRLRALDQVSFSMPRYKTLGIVGESGSGKTTLAKILLGLIPKTGGELEFDRQTIKNFRKDVQIIFQNPYNSLNPKMRIDQIIREPIIIHGTSDKKACRAKVLQLLRLVALPEEILSRYPEEFSGGQRQRISIARALASEPKFIVLDEPISSLDLTIQVRMIDLFKELKDRLNLTYIFISHNLALIKHMADSVLVMQKGRIVEQGSTELILRRPRTAYTKLLLESAREF